MPVNRAVNNQGDRTLFDRIDFSYDQDRETLTCPGRSLTRQQLMGRKHMVIYTAQAQDRSQWPLKSRCTTKQAPGLSPPV